MSRQVGRRSASSGAAAAAMSFDLSLAADDKAFCAVVSSLRVAACLSRFASRVSPTFGASSDVTAISIFPALRDALPPAFRSRRRSRNEPPPLPAPLTPPTVVVETAAVRPPSGSDVDSSVRSLSASLYKRRVSAHSANRQHTPKL